MPLHDKVNDIEKIVIICALITFMIVLQHFDIKYDI